MDMLFGLDEKLTSWLEEDIGSGDITTNAIVAPEMQTKAIIHSKADGVLAGVEVAARVFRLLDENVRFTAKRADGDTLDKTTVIAEVRGSARAILTGERLALNLLQHMSGVATRTAKLAAIAAPYGAKLVDTRKTTPGLRLLDKYAVKVGGGANHRMGLYDRILMKDNHRRLWRGGDPDALDQAVLAARKAFPKLDVEVEVESVRECKSALQAKPEWIMLDNMGLADMKTCVRLCRGVSKTEASGGITLDRAQAVAATGVTAISLGCLTHSQGSVDLTLEWKAV